MKTTAVRLYGADDMRIETFELPKINEDEILMKVVSDSVCASTYKAVKQGAAHKRVPNDIAENPIVIGHEMCGEIIEVGSALRNEWKEGQLVVIQPALKLENNYDPGYSYQYIGGNMTYAVVPKVVLDRGCLLPYSADNFYSGSLVEPIGCCIRGFKGLYHTDYTTYTRIDGAKRGGKLAILGGAGPMGFASIELAIGYAGCSQLSFGFCENKQLPLQEVADYLNLTPEQVRRVTAKALRRLRHPARSHVILKHKSDYFSASSVFYKNVMTEAYENLAHQYNTAFK